MMSIGGRYARRAAGMAVLAALALVAPARADDASLRQRIEARLGKAGLAENGQIQVEVTNGAAVLSGFTTTVDAQRQAEKAARKVRAQIRVQPGSSFDSRLRVELYRRIYGNGLFQRYATFVNPPIRIIVEHGNITLTGVVNSRVERATLESIARGVLAFKVDNE